MQIRVRIIKMSPSIYGRYQAVRVYADNDYAYIGGRCYTRKGCKRGALRQLRNRYRENIEIDYFQYDTTKGEIV